IISASCQSFSRAGTSGGKLLISGARPRRKRAPDDPRPRRCYVATVGRQPKKTSRRRTGGSRRRQRVQALLRRSGWAGYAVVLVIGIGIGLLLALPLQQHLRPRPAPRPALSSVVAPPS